MTTETSLIYENLASIFHKVFAPSEHYDKANIEHMRTNKKNIYKHEKKEKKKIQDLPQGEVRIVLVCSWQHFRSINKHLTTEKQVYNAK